MKLVVDASVAVAAAATPFGFERLRAFDLAAPPLLWIEADSALHAAAWRGELRPDQTSEMRQRLARARISKANPSAWRTRRSDRPRA